MSKGCTTRQGRLFSIGVEDRGEGNGITNQTTEEKSGVECITKTQYVPKLSSLEGKGTAARDDFPTRLKGRAEVILKNAINLFLP